MGIECALVWNMLCLHMNPIQIPTHKGEQLSAGVPQATLHLCEDIEEEGKADQGASREVEDISETILARPGGGYLNDHHAVLPHLAQDLREQGNGWKGIA